MIRYSHARQLRRCTPLSLSQSPQVQIVRSFFDNFSSNAPNNLHATFDDGSNSLAPSKLGSGDSAPRYPHILVIPVVGRPVFPMLPTAVTLRDEETIAAVEKLSQGNSYVGVFLRKTHSSGVTEGGVILEKPELITDPTELYRVGTFCQVHRFTKSQIDPNDPMKEHSFEEGDAPSENPISLWLMGQRRIDLTSIDSVGPPIDATVSHWDRLEHVGEKDTIRALSNEALSTIREVAQMNALFRESLTFFPARIDANDPFKLADFCASISKSASPEELQAVLEEKDPEIRLHKALVLLNKEREVAKLQKEISSKVEEKMTDAQRKYFLVEQLKSIKKELGIEQDDKEALIEKYRKQLAEYPEIPTEIQQTIDQELEKLSSLEKNSSEFNVTRSYLDWLCDMPWGKMTDENFDLKAARKVLNRDHYGLDDVKDIILQFIAVGKLKGSVQGQILCLGKFLLAYLVGFRKLDWKLTPALSF